ncbi:MAG: phage tail assembly protein [Lachnospiraceae bacterium]|nr:phage tail assembly protein [Lachnospiraceae bacterium]
MEENMDVEVVKAAAEETSVVIVKLRKEFEFEGITYNEFKLDFDSLKGVDFIKIEKEMNSLNEFALSPEISPNYCARIAARAAGVPAEVIMNLSLKDFNTIKNKARDFLAVLD